ncbi:unnamed protein product [Prorocentrum cordatum]|uniref:Uncharacterized protein n=1 Tax=Prorocentrum cordatum TaxID=2364126 RepID=A0ABN9UA72_9DINO|nr:unnamed protein product [Polarella glacialis]
MSLRFDGKVAVVTGSGGGVGRVYAIAFAERGAKVLVNDIGGSLSGTGSSSKAADDVVAEIVARGGAAIANYDSVENGDKIIDAAVKAFGSVDILVNNAGIIRDVTLSKMTDKDWDTVHTVNLRGVYKCTKAAWPHMIKQGFGRIGGDVPGAVELVKSFVPSLPPGELESSAEHFVIIWAAAVKLKAAPIRRMASFPDTEANIAMDVKRARLQQVKGRRATTLEKRYRDLLKVRSFLMARKGYALPRDAGDILESLQVRLEEPCRRTVLTAAVEAIGFLEKGGGVRPQEMLASDPLVKNFVLEAMAQGKMPSSGFRHKAPRPVVVIVIALERVVIDESAEVYKRMLAFCKLCKFWGGKDKSNEILPYTISTEAFLEVPMWLSVGADLWSHHAPGERDYFLAAPSVDYTGVAHREVKYHECAALAFLPRAATLLGFDKEWVDTSGRRQGDRSEAYFWVHRRRVETIQHKVSYVIRENMGKVDVFDEEDTLAALARRDASLPSLLTLAPPMKRQDSEFLAAPRPSSTRGRVYAHKLPESVQGHFALIGRSGFRRLRCASACPRAPGLGFQGLYFEEMGLLLPDASECHDFCRSCWKGDARPAEDEDEAQVSSAAGSSDEERPRRCFIGLLSLLQGSGALRHSDVFCAQRRAGIGVQVIFGREKITGPMLARVGRLADASRVWWSLRCQPGPEGCLKSVKVAIEKDVDYAAASLLSGLKHLLRRLVAGTDATLFEEARVLSMRRHVRSILDEAGFFMERWALIGAGHVLPRTPQVFEPKTRWPLVPQRAEDAHEVNAFSASPKDRGNHQSARRVAELREGAARNKLAFRISLEETRRRFGHRLAIASLGAQAQSKSEDGSASSRLLFDAAHGVDLNRRIKVRDKIPFPKARGVKRFLRAAQDEGSLAHRVELDVADARRALRFALFADWCAMVQGAGFARAIACLVLCLPVLGAPLSWKRSGGGMRLAWIGYEPDATGKIWSLGTSEARAAWITSGYDRVVRDAFVSILECEASGDMVTVAGWEAALPGEGGAPPSTKRARWFYMELDQQTAPWAFSKGAPFRSISALELLASTVGLMMFVPEGVANWDGRCIASCLTDSQVASRVVEKFMSTKLPLDIVAMEPSAQLEARRAGLVSEWAPGDLNCQAGADSTTKSGILGFTRSCALEGARRGVLSNAVCPIAASRMTETVLPEKVLKSLQPDRCVAPLVLCLCHEGSSANGEVIEAGGGWFAKVRWERSKGAFLAGSFGPEDVAGAMNKITSFAESDHPESAQDTFAAVLSAATASKL